MKTLLLFILLAFSVSAEEKTEKTYTAAEFTHAGETYQDVKITLAAANKASVTHREGVFGMHPKDLSPDIHSELGYDAAAAATADFPLFVKCSGAKEQGGKFRWFFRVTNKGKGRFLGSFRITILDQNSYSDIGGETFISKGAPGMAVGEQGLVNFFTHTGPVSVHGDYGMAGFRCELTDGEGKLSGIFITEKVIGKLLEN